MMTFNDNGSATIICPMKCGGSVLIAGNQTTNSLPNNYSLQSVLDIIKTSYDNKGTICYENEDCSNSICRSCAECSMKTCAICWDKHQCENKTFTNISFDQNSSCFHPWCEEHQTYAKYICFDCNERFVCLYCVNRNHKGHAKETITKYAPSTRSWFTSQINVSKDYLMQSQTNVSYKEELRKINYFRIEIERELKARMLDRLSSYVDRLKRENDVLLDNFEAAVATFKEDLENPKLLGTNTTQGLTTYDEELAIKQDFEILFERKAIVKKIDDLSVIPCFKASLSTECHGKDLLGNLNVGCTKRNQASRDNKAKIVDLEIEHIFENKFTKEIDLELVIEHIRDLGKPTTLAKPTKIVEDSPIRELLTESYMFNDIKELIKNDDIDLLKIASRQQPDIIKMRDENKNTFIQITAILGKYDALRVLLQLSNEYDNDDDDGNPALICASRNGHGECVELLLEYNADVNRQAYDTDTALICASRNGHKGCVEILLQYNADVNDTNDDGYTALMVASYSGHKECVNILLENNADVNITNNGSYTALIYAARHDHIECVKKLLEYKADVNIKSIHGSTALLCTSSRGFKECVKMILEHNADVNIKWTNGDTALLDASGYGYTECVKMLLEYKADVNIRNNDGNTALLDASGYGYTECVKILLEYKADVNIKNNDGNTALIIASQRGHAECVKMLLEYKADVNIKNNNGITALMLAAHEQKECVKMLLEYKADVNIKNNNGITALMLAAYEQKECLKMLLEYNADVNDINNDGETALIIWASYDIKSDKECMKILLEHHADVNIKSNDGSTALMHASHNGHEEYVRMLLEYHADVNIKNIHGNTAYSMATNNEIRTMINKY